MGSDPRTLIIDAAGAVFARYGFKKASVEDIARRAGVGKGSIYLHFDSKEALFEAVLRLAQDKAMAELVEAVGRAKTPEAQVRAFIDTRLEQSVRVARDYVLTRETLLELDPQAQRLLPELMAREIALVERILAEGNAQGAFRVKEPHLVAVGLMEALGGLSINLITRGQEAPLRAAVGALFDVFLRGLLPPRK